MSHREPEGRDRCIDLTRVAGGLVVLAAFYGHLGELAAGYVKDQAQRAERWRSSRAGNARSTSSWRWPDLARLTRGGPIGPGVPPPPGARSMQRKEVAVMARGKSRAALGILLALQTVGAVGGAIFVVPNLSVDNLKTAVFSDYTVPALGLGVIVGGLSLVALVLLLRRSHFAALYAAAAGFAVMLFEIVEVTALKSSVFTDPGQLALWQQPLWFAIGAVIAILSPAARLAHPVRRLAA